MPTQVRILLPPLLFGPGQWRASKARAVSAIPTAQDRPNDVWRTTVSRWQLGCDSRRVVLRRTSAVVVGFAACALVIPQGALAGGPASGVFARVSVPGTAAVSRLAVRSGEAALSARGRRACRQPRSKTVARSSTGRIYSKRGTETFGVAGDEPGTRYFGCLYATGRSRVLAFTADYFGDLASTFQYAFRIAGRYAAFLERTGGESGYGIAVARRDLKTGAWRRDNRPARAPNEGQYVSPPFNSEEYAPSDLVLTRTGALAWTIAPYSGCSDSFPCRVLKADREGRAVLDEGPGIRPKSLALNGSTVTWISAGEERSAILR